MKILALDLSTNTGWACGETGCAPRHGTIRLPKTKKDIGRFAYAFEYELTALLGEHKPDRVCFESPIMTAATGIYTARKLYGLAYHTELLCVRLGLPCSETHMQTARGTLGAKPLPRKVRGVNGMRMTTKAERRKHIKAEVMRLCRLMGWEPANDDEADALAVWYDACHQFDRARLRLAF